MTVTSFKEQHRDKSRLSRQEYDKTRYFIAITNDVNDGELELLAFRPDLAPGQAHPTIPGLFVEAFIPSRIKGSNAHNIVVEHANGEEEEDPLARDAKIEFSTQDVTEFTVWDADGDPMQNTAGDLFQPQEVEASRWIMSVSKNLAQVPPWILIYQNVINDADITIRGISWPKWSLLLKNLRIPDFEVENDVRFIPLSFQLHYNKKLWIRRIVNEGFNELVTIANTNIDIQMPIQFGPMKERPTEPFLLDEDGKAFRDVNGNVTNNVPPEDIVIFGKAQARPPSVRRSAFELVLETYCGKIRYGEAMHRPLRKSRRSRRWRAPARPA